METRSWWEQPTREAFMAAHAHNLDRILLSGQTNPIARQVDAMLTAQWAQGFPKRGRAPIQPVMRGGVL